MNRFISLIVVFVVSAVTASSSSYAFSYSVTALSESSVAYSVSNSGQVVGIASHTVFTWLGNTFTTLPVGDSYFAVGNNTGQICGTTYQNSAFLWQNGQSQDIGALSPGYCCALGISNNGEVVGQTRISNGHSHAYVWDGTMHDLGALAADYSCAYDINDSGDVVGWVTAVGLATQHACLWKNGAIQDLGTLSGDTYSNAYGVNNLGQIVGDSYDSAGRGQAFVCDNGVMSALSSVPGYAYSCAKAINNSGTIVGYAFNSTSDYHPVVWVNGIPQLLPTEDGVGGKALGLNDNGWIVGYAQDKAILWKPVPELSGILVLLMGISCMITILRCGLVKKHMIP